MPRTASTLDVATTGIRARDLLNARIESVQTLVLARQELDELNDQVSAAETEDARTYRAALTDGWTPEELKKLGLDEPAKQARVRRRSVRTQAAESTTGPPAEG